MPHTTPTTKTPTTPLQEELFEPADLPSEPDDDLNLHDEEDSYIYGDADATDEDTIETMTVYDPDADRFEDLEENSGDNETVVCYAYSRKTGEPVATLAIDEVSRQLTNNSQFIWLGLHDPSFETVKEVQDAFDLHELALEDAFADHQRPKVESYGNDTIFVVVRTAKLEDNYIRYGTTAIFMGKNFIISVRRGASNSYTPVREHCHRRPEKLRLGPIFVLHAILDFIVDNYLPITDRLGNYLREQERNIFSYEFSKSTLKSLYELKSQLVHMRAVILPVQDVCNFFINHKKNELVSAFPAAAKPYFRDVNDHLLRSIDAVNGLNEMLSVAMDTYMAMVTMGQNDVVRKLAAWAGIAAVPTAVAGVYGMNFDFMPELHWKYGYFMVIGTVLTVCFFLYYKFRKAGWL
ncbi:MULTISPECIES: magnesium/cobalt transporter CorA [Moraxella]|nr:MULTISPECIES: magnesium/cobalt transporter CorA [Moraxella]MBE9579420.1 magnesium/cobalt transporter CorA [Moraxella sp. K1664]MBE9588767.1 magnesium/cobalt transporter CorA [Moraxella sp. K1630]MBE9596993.1 magnesium/cobalt transporter CorA [Moraxella sp. K2450]MDH9219558.1 magnesium/cobalt transporter CorA [Moraxella lacunata]MDI4483482.1 magnesium/cobalt transporter CorA [Moraxella lacunata]